MHFVFFNTSRKHKKSTHSSLAAWWLPTRHETNCSNVEIYSCENIWCILRSTCVLTMKKMFMKPSYLLLVLQYIHSEIYSGTWLQNAESWRVYLGNSKHNFQSNVIIFTFWMGCLHQGEIKRRSLSFAYMTGMLQGLKIWRGELYVGPKIWGGKQ